MPLSIHPEKPRNLQQSERTPNTAKRCFSNRKCWKEVIQLEQISRGLFWVTCGFQVLEIDNTGSGQWQWRPPAPALARLEHLTTFYNMLRLSRRVLQFCPPPYIATSFIFCSCTKNGMQIKCSWDHYYFMATSLLKTVLWTKYAFNDLLDPLILLSLGSDWGFVASWLPIIWHFAPILSWLRCTLNTFQYITAQY